MKVTLRALSALRIPAGIPVSCTLLREIRYQNCLRQMPVEEIDTDYFVTFDHPMTKDHYLSFLAYVKSDRVFLNRLYPEQSPTCRFPITTGGKLFVYCIKHGLSVYSGNL